MSAISRQHCAFRTPNFLMESADRYLLKADRSLMEELQ